MMNLKEKITTIIENGNQTHDSKGSCAGVSLQLTPHSIISIKNTYNATEPIARDLTWKNDEGEFVSFIKQETFSSENNTWFIIAGGLSYPYDNLYIIKTEGETLRELLQNCDHQMFYSETTTWYTYDHNDDSIKVHHLSFEKSQDWSGQLPWSVWLGAPTAWMNIQTEVVDQMVATEIGIVEDDYGRTHNLVIGHNSVYQQWSGDRYRQVTSVPITTPNQPRNFTFNYVEKEGLIILYTAEGVASYHINSIHLATQPINQVLRLVVNKLYIQVGQKYYKFKTTQKTLQIRTASPSLADCKDLGFCVKGSLYALCKNRVALKQFQDAGLIVSREIESWTEISEKILNFKVKFSLAQVRELMAGSSYYKRLFTANNSGSRRNSIDYHAVYAPVGRAIVHN